MFFFFSFFIGKILFELGWLFVFISFSFLNILLSLKKFLKFDFDISFEYEFNNFCMSLGFSFLIMFVMVELVLKFNCLFKVLLMKMLFFVIFCLFIVVYEELFSVFVDFFLVFVGCSDIWLVLFFFVYFIMLSILGIEEFFFLIIFFLKSIFFGFGFRFFMNFLWLSLWWILMLVIL